MSTLSPEQKDALQLAVIAAVASPPAGVPTFPDGSVFWTETDAPVNDPPYITLTELGSDEQGLDGDEQYIPEHRAQIDTITIPALPSSELYDVEVNGELVASVDGTGLTQAQLRDAVIAEINGSDLDDVVTATASGTDVLVTADEAGLAFVLEVVSGTGMTSTTTTANIDLVRYQRDTYEVTVAIQVHVMRSETNPRHADDAAVVTRRLRSRIWNPERHAELDAVGCPILRRGTLRDLSANTGSRTESVSEIEIVLGVASIDRDEVGSMRSFEGEGTLTEENGDELVIPFDTSTES